MDISKLVALGSQTAKAGFKNEDDVVNRFNAWQTNELAKLWLSALGYDVSKIQAVKSNKAPPGQKADVQVQVKLFESDLPILHNLQVKLVSNPQGFNQIDKRWVETYGRLWDIPIDLTTILKRFTGELAGEGNLSDLRRTLLTEMNLSDQQRVLNFFTENKKQILSDLFIGRGNFCADHILVILKQDDYIKWSLLTMPKAINILGSGEIRITNKGSLRIGKITMQRKGGDGGRKSAQMLQFKINPIQLFV